MKIQNFLFTLIYLVGWLLFVGAPFIGAPWDSILMDIGHLLIVGLPVGFFMVKWGLGEKP